MCSHGTLPYSPPFLANQTRPSHRFAIAWLSRRHHTARECGVRHSAMTKEGHVRHSNPPPDTRQGRTALRTYRTTVYVPVVTLVHRRVRKRRRHYAGASTPHPRTSFLICQHDRVPHGPRLTRHPKLTHAPLRQLSRARGADMLGCPPPSRAVRTHGQGPYTAAPSRPRRLPAANFVQLLQLQGPYRCSVSWWRAWAAARRLWRLLTRRESCSSGGASMLIPCSLARESISLAREHGISIEHRPNCKTLSALTGPLRTLGQGPYIAAAP